MTTDLAPDGATRVFLQQGSPRRPGLARPIAPGEGTAPLLAMVGPRCIGGGKGRNEPYHASDEPRGI